MKGGSLYRRIAVTFAAILLLLGVALGLLGYSAAKMHQHEILQGLSRGLAQRMAATPEGAADLDAVKQSLKQVTTVNPNVEAYLLDPRGRIVGHWPNADAPLQGTVSLEPIHHFLAGESLPLHGDNPRDRGRPEIFSAAAIERNGAAQGYVYLILLSGMYHAMVDEALGGYVLSTAAWIGLIALALALMVGLATFFWITQRLQRLTVEIDAYRARHLQHDPSPTGDEISHLQQAFGQMRDRLDQQMAELQRQDELRRELIANVSHDLRTPLTSMLGYLEMLAHREESLRAEQRREFLMVAVRQSRKVARLAQQLFELARLECEETLPEPELFSLDELVHDITQKFALAAQDKRLRLEIKTDAGAGFVRGDIGMLERVISNLVDNAIRHTQGGGTITLTTRHTPQGVEVSVADTGQGIDREHLSGLFERDSALRVMAYKRGGGLGLLIAKRILNLHGAVIHAVSEVGRGTAISFVLPLAA